MLRQLLGLITVASIKNYGSGFDPILTDAPGCKCMLHCINCQTIHDIVIFILISSIKIKLAMRTGTPASPALQPRIGSVLNNMAREDAIVLKHKILQCYSDKYHYT